ncbi:MAG: hypothetical protein AAF483_13850 [Planctomycetota bacterium]
MAWDALLVVGRQRIGLGFIPRGNSERATVMHNGEWAYFENGETFLRIRFRQVEDPLPYPDGYVVGGNRRRIIVAEPCSLETSPADGSTGFEYITVRPSELVPDHNRLKPVYKLGEWRYRCKAVATHLSALLEKARMNHGVDSVDRLRIVSIAENTYVPNIFCNAAGRALGMRKCTGSSMHVGDRAWDDRALYAIRRCHVSDLFRSDKARFMALSFPDRDPSRLSGIWTWRNTGRAIVQDGDSVADTLSQFRGRTPADFDLLEKGSSLSPALLSSLHEWNIRNIFIDSLQCVEYSGAEPAVCRLWQIGEGKMLW